LGGSHRVSGDHMDAMLLGREAHGPVLVARRDADELEMRDHAADPTNRRGGESSEILSGRFITIVIKTICMKAPRLASARSGQAPARLDAYVLETLMPDLVGHDRQP